MFIPTTADGFNRTFQYGGVFSCRRSFFGLNVLMLWIAALTSVLAAGSEPFIPKADKEILEVLPRSVLSNEVADLRRQLSSSPHEFELASNVARRFQQLGKQEGDPRFFGFARAAIQPWWEMVDAPASVIKIRAKLKENEHDYDEAILDLNRYVKLVPRDAQAWVELANIYRVQGKYDEAWNASNTLSEFAGFVPTVLSKAPILAVTGHAEDAYASLTTALPMARKDYPQVVDWLLTMQGEIAQSISLDREAELHFRDALEMNPTDRYLIRAYAEFLLDHGREKESLALVRDHTTDDGLLLCAALAANRCHESQLANKYLAELETRFDEIRLRGGEPHGKYEARVALELKHDPRKALEIALVTWQKQKELRDSRNVLEAAVAAGQPNAATPVIDFLGKYGTQDGMLKKLASQILDSN